MSYVVISTTSETCKDYCTQTSVAHYITKEQAESAKDKLEDDHKHNNTINSSKVVVDKVEVKPHSDDCLLWYVGRSTWYCQKHDIETECEAMEPMCCMGLGMWGPKHRDHVYVVGKYKMYD
jgi:hypothetical protein